MNRRGFFGLVGGAVAGAVTAKAVAPETPKLSLRLPPIPVEHATQLRAIIGVAMHDVRAGDLVQIQTHGRAMVNMK